MRVKRSRRIHLAVSLAGTLALVASVAACTSSNAGSADNSTSRSGGSNSPKAGGTLTYLWPVDAPDLNPDTGFGPSFATGSLERFAIYDALVVLTSTATVDYRIAKSLTSSDSTTWRLVLRPAVKFSDGTPFDAAAVKSNWDQMTGAPGKAAYAPIASTKVVDSTTLDITLKTANALFPQYLAQQNLSFIGSPTAEKEGPAKFGQHPIGAGPYTLKSWVHNSQLDLTKNPSYYGKTYLDQIKIKVISDETQRYNSLVAGGGDALFTSDYTTGAKAKQAGYQDEFSIQGGGLAIIFNTKKAPFDDVRARQAVAEALDASKLSTTIYAGAASIVQTLFGEDSPFYTDVQQTKPNAEHAQQLFDQLAAEGKRVEFTIVAPASPQITAPAQWMQSTLAGFKNVSVKVDPLPPAEAVSQASAHDFTAFVGPVRFVDPYPNLSDYVTTSGISNYGQYSNSTVDSAFQSGLTQDQSARKTAYASMQEQLIKDIPLYWLVRSANQQVFKSSVVGAVPVINGGLPDWTKAWKQ